MRRHSEHFSCAVTFAASSLSIHWCQLVNQFTTPQKSQRCTVGSFLMFRTIWCMNRHRVTVMPPCYASSCCKCFRLYWFSCAVMIIISGRPTGLELNNFWRSISVIIMVRNVFPLYFTSLSWKWAVHHHTTGQTTNKFSTLFKRISLKYLKSVKKIIVSKITNTILLTY